MSLKKESETDSIRFRSHTISVIISAHGVMVIVVGNGHGDTISNPERDWLHFT